LVNNIENTVLYSRLEAATESVFDARDGSARGMTYGPRPVDTFMPTGYIQIVQRSVTYPAAA